MKYTFSQIIPVTTKSSLVQKHEVGAHKSPTEKKNQGGSLHGKSLFGSIDWNTFETLQTNVQSKGYCSLACAQHILGMFQVNFKSFLMRNLSKSRGISRKYLWLLFKSHWSSSHKLIFCVGHTLLFSIFPRTPGESEANVIKETIRHPAVRVAPCDIDDAIPSSTSHHTPCCLCKPSAAQQQQVRWEFWGVWISSDGQLDAFKASMSVLAF